MKKLFFGLSILLVIAVKLSAQEWQRLADPLVKNCTNLKVVTDNVGTVYAAYDNSSNNFKLNVKKFDGKKWSQLGSEDFSKGQVSNISITMDKTNTPYIVYTDIMREGKTLVQKFNGKDWITVGKSEVSSDHINSSSIVFDQNNAVYLALADQNKQKIAVYKLINDAWKELPSPQSESTCEQITLTFDKNYNLYICYADTKIGKKIVVKKFVDDTWVMVGKTSASMYESKYISFTLDNKNIPYVAYLDMWDNKIATKKFDGSNWVAVGDPVFTASCENVSMVIGPNDVPYVSFYNSSNFDHNIVIKKFDGIQWVDATPSPGKANMEFNNLYANENTLFAAFNEVKKGAVVKKVMLN